MHLEGEEVEDERRVDRGEHEAFARRPSQQIKAAGQVERRGHRQAERRERGEREAFAQLDQHGERAPHVGHLVLEEAARERKQAREHLQRRAPLRAQCNERPPHDAEGEHNCGADAGETREASRPARLAPTHTQEEEEERQRVVQLHLFVVERQGEERRGRHEPSGLEALVRRRHEEAADGELHEAEADAVVLKVAVVDEHERRVD